MRKIIVADYEKKYLYKGYVILKRKSNGDSHIFYAIYHHKMLKKSTDSLKAAKAIINEWIGE